MGLFYRVAVMYAASRIILALKRKNEGYESRKLSEEEPVSRLLLSREPLLKARAGRARDDGHHYLRPTYPHRRFDLSPLPSRASAHLRLAVYTHLLLLSSSGHQSFWRWTSLFLTIGLWAVELMIGNGGADEARWKSD